MCVPVRVCAFYPAFLLPDLKRNPGADKEHWREKPSKACPAPERPLCALPKPHITRFPCHVPHAISGTHEQFAITVLCTFSLFNYYYCYYYLHLPVARFLQETAAALAAPNNLSLPQGVPSCAAPRPLPCPGPAAPSSATAGTTVQSKTLPGTDGGSLLLSTWRAPPLLFGAVAGCRECPKRGYTALAI